jgi:glycosyltransferase involved in cell wall biosynthesis
MTSFSAEILCSSRELFGADRAALRLGRVLSRLGGGVRLVVPSQREELGLGEAARTLHLEYEPRPTTIVSSSGVERPFALWAPAPARVAPDFTIVNSTAVIPHRNGRGKTIQIVREWIEPGSAKHRVLARYLARSSSFAVGVSSDVARQWSATCRSPAATVNDWLDDEDLVRARSRRLPPDERRGHILCVGRFNQWKGQEVLAAAFRRAFHNRPTTDRPSLTFLGAQQQSPFRERGEAVRSASNGLWRVEPFVDDPGAELSRASLVVVPSLHPEPFGLVVLEALAHGCQVMAFPGGGPADLHRVIPAAVTIVERDELALAEALTSWWDCGGTAPDKAALERTDHALQQRWSDSAANEAWRGLLRGPH